MPCRRILAVVLLTAPFFTGCAILESTKKLLTEQPGDYIDGTETVNEDWSIAGKEGRGNRSRQTDPDPVWGKYFISAKHRDIERNLGIDHNY